MDFSADTALIVADCQNDFADPDGSLHVQGAAGVISAVNDLIASAKGAGAFVVYTQDWHPPDTPHFQKDGGTWPVHCVKGTWGSAFHPELVVDGPSVRKGSNGEDGYSGFTMADPETGEETLTELKGLLDERGIRRTVVTGLALDYCVKATALDAVGFGFATVLPRQATAPVDVEPGDGEAALSELRSAGVSIL